MMILLLKASLETLVMVFTSGLTGVIFGIPLGLLLYLTGPGGLIARPRTHFLFSISTNILRSIPYIILIVIMIPLTRLLVGSSIGLLASIVPLSVASFLLVARMAQDAFKTIAPELVETGVALGAPLPHIITKILLPESLPVLVSGFTNILIMLVGFSAMAGAVGGGGLGDLAIRYGYQRYDALMLLIIVVILVGLVQLIQTVGETLARKLSH